MTLPLLVTTAFGVEAVVRRELEALGYQPKITGPGRLAFAGDFAAIARANLFLRSAERVLIELATFPASDFDLLFDGVQAVDWAQWIPPDGEIPVRGRSHQSQLTSVPAVQRTVKKAIVQRLMDQHQVTQLPETGPCYGIEIALAKDIATLTLDTTGVGLHKRGYRPVVSAAPLRETLAATIVQLSVWRNGRPLWDPFCGAGTLAIEAALLGRRIAPGLKRTFIAEEWPQVPATAWQAAREEAQDLVLPPLEERIQATDANPQVLRTARQAAERAGVAEDIHFQERAFEDVRSKREHGCIITNPPYGERLGRDAEIEALYRNVPLVLRRLPTWSHYVLTSRADFEQLVGQPAHKRRKLYNGRIECTLYQWLGPKPPRAGEASKPPIVSTQPDTQQAPTPATKPDATRPPNETSLPETPPVSPAPVFGGLKPEAARQAEDFGNRLRKNARHLRKWPTKRGITCFRLYDRDVPEVPLAIDRYDDALHIAEYERPHDRTPAEHADWLDLMVQTAAQVLETPRELVFVKRRERQRGASQYGKVADALAVRLIKESGLTFKLNLSDYLDTGLFLDHRVARGMVRKEAEGKRVLNLFAYTGSFSVYALAGGAKSVATVDLSPTYLDWAEDNIRLNKLADGRGEVIEADSRQYVESLPRQPLFDLAIVDPPTFSNTKRGQGEVPDWDIQQDAAPLLAEVAARLAPGGAIYFSTNSRRFKLDESQLAGLHIREISRQTVPEDFRNKRIHRCWRMVKSDV